MSSHSVRADGSAVSRADRALFWIESRMNLFAGGFVLAIMLLSVVNILGRKLLNMPVAGYIDWMMQAVPIMAVLGIAYCQRLGGHIRMDFVVGKLHGRALWTFEFIGVLVMLLVTLALIYGSWDLAERAYRLGDSTVDINLPTWPVKMLFPAMFTLLALRLVLQLWAYGRAIRTGAPYPVGAPLIEDPETQALHEAETVSGLEETDK